MEIKETTNESAIKKLACKQYGGGGGGGEDPHLGWASCQSLIIAPRSKLSWSTRRYTYSYVLPYIPHSIAM